MKAILNIVMLFVLVFNQAGQSTWSRVLNQAETPAATPTPILESTPTETPQPAPPTPTGMPTETPILGSPTPTETPVVDPATPAETPIPETATPTELPPPSETPTFVPTETPMPDGTPDGTATLELDFTPAGRRLLLHWKTTGLTFRKDTVTLALTLPSGVTPANGDREIFDPATGVLELDLKKPNGNVLLQSGSLEEGARISASLFRNGGLAANAVLELPAVEKHAMDERGGELATLNGRVRIKFPQSLLAGSTTVTVGRPDKRSAPDYSLSGNEFEIEAFADADDSELHTFSDRITIEVEYDESSIAGYEGDLKLHWYDPEHDKWFVLPSQVDTEANILRGFTNHFTVFDYGVDSLQIAHLPTLDTFQVAEFTGAASYSLPIQVPPGPAGLQPNLSLSYNSQVIDQASFMTQASWVGMGWSLDTPYIERNNHGTDSINIDDTFILTLNGVGGLLLKGTDGYYHTQEESFVRVEYNETDDFWVAYDKSGNIYEFKSRAKFGNYLGETSTWRWSLTKVRDINNNVLTYNYETETRQISYQGGSYTTTLAVYPNTITYSHGWYRIRFVRDQNRSDYDLTWTNPEDATFHLRSRLTSIIIEQDEDRNGSFEKRIKTYTFLYETNPARVIFPQKTWDGVPAGERTPENGNGKNLTLVGIQESAGGVSLPATTFEYDTMHLVRAENGYGGAIEFEYETTPWHADIAPESSKVDQRFGDNYCKTSRGENSPDSYWRASDSANNGLVQCSGALAFSTKVKNTRLKNNMTYDPTLLKPGSYYRLHASIQWARSSVTNQLGTWAAISYSDGLGTTQFPQKTLTSYPKNFDYVLLLDENAKTLILYADSDGAAMVQFTFEVLPTFYRVAEKRIYSGAASPPIVYKYTYTGAAVNSPKVNGVGISAEAATNNPFTQPYSEFRGHATVTVEHPDGHTAVTEYNQSDRLQGQPSKITVKSAGGKLLTQTLLDYTTETLAILDGAALPHIRPYDDPTGPYGIATGLSVYTRYTSEQINKTYSGSGVWNDFTATRTTYDSYDAYGNLTLSSEYSGDSSVLPVEWQLYRKTETLYYPNTNGVYLAGFPASVKVTDAGGAILSRVLYVYDGQSAFNQPPSTGLLTSVRTLVKFTGGAGQYNFVDYGYDAYGNQTSVTTYDTLSAHNVTPAGGARTSTTVFDPNFHVYPIKMTNPLWHETLLEYDFTKGVPTREIPPNSSNRGTTSDGSTKTDNINTEDTEAEYDAFGRVTKLIRPGDTTSNPTLWVIYHDTNPFWVEIRQRVAGDQYYALRRYYDGLGRQVKVETGSFTIGQGFIPFNTVDYEFEYTSNSYITRQSMPYGNGETPAFTETVFDALGRPKSVTAPGNIKTSYAYDGLKTTVTDANGNATISIADAWGNTLHVDPADGPSVGYVYDTLSRLTQAVRGPESAVASCLSNSSQCGSGLTSTTLTYDLAGRKLSMSDPDMGNWTYTYDALGNLKTQTDARSCILTMSYDPLNRLTDKVSSGAGCGTQVNTSYTYDEGDNSLGFRTGMGDDSGSTAWSYDERGRVESETKTISGNTFVTKWGYNSADMPTWMKYPDNETVNYAYTGEKMLASVIGNAAYVQSATYDPAGRITHLVRGNGTLDTTYTYFPWDQQGGRLQRLSTRRVADQTFMQDLTYAYDPAGNILTIADALAGPQTQTFTYDDLDRLTSAVVIGGVDGLYSETYTYDANTGNLSSKGGMTYTYNSGHAHAVSSLSNGNSYQYDANGNMTVRNVGGQTFTLTYDAENRLVSVSGAMTASFVYDGDGKQVKATVNGVMTYYVGAHYEVSGSTITKYYFAGTTRVAVRRNGVLSYLLGDHLGSSSVTTNASGVKTAQALYKAFGETRFSSGSLNTTYKFTNHREEASLGLYFFKARFYDPSLGRFISADSITFRPPRNSDTAQSFVALTVDFHETNLLDYANEQNREAMKKIGEQEEKGTEKPGDTSLEPYQPDNPNLSYAEDKALELLGLPSRTEKVRRDGKEFKPKHPDSDIQSKASRPLPKDLVFSNTLDRYSYARSCPTRYTDPSGHDSQKQCIGKLVASFITLEGATVITLGGVILLGGSFTIGAMTFGLSVAPSLPVIAVGATMELIAAGTYVAGVYMLADAVECFGSSN